jgi:hypothetical protein
VVSLSIITATGIIIIPVEQKQKNGFVNSQQKRHNKIMEFAEIYSSRSLTETIHTVLQESCLLFTYQTFALRPHVMLCHT